MNGRHKESVETTTKNGGHEDVIIEIDYSMISGAKAKRVKNLYINERFMKTGVNETKPTTREMKKIFTDLQQLHDNIETIHVDLDSTQITGSMLGSCISDKIMELHVQSGLVLMNQDDRTALGKEIYEHEFLTRIVMKNLIVRERLVNRWNSNPAPPLDILVPAFISVTFLNSLELSLSDGTGTGITTTTEDKSQPPTPTPTTTSAATTTATVASMTPSKPMLSFLGVKELLHISTLERLELTRFGLTDDHYGVLVEQISQRSSKTSASSFFLRTLILNENAHSENGLDMLAALLIKPECPLEHLECYQSSSPVKGVSLELFEQAMKMNTTIKELRIHLPTGSSPGDSSTDDETQQEQTNCTGSLIPFYLELNRKGRKRLVDKKTTYEEWMELVVGVKDDPSLLYYCLRNSRFWWTCKDIPKSRLPDFVMPVLPQMTRIVVSPVASPLGTSTRKTLGRRLKALKNRHGELLDGIDVKTDDDDDDDEDDDGDKGDDDEGSLDDIENLIPTDSSISRDLAARKIPPILSINTQQDYLQDSAISIGGDSYINDLLHQKKKLPREAREEVLEEALEELQYVLDHDKLPPGMSKDLYFHKVLERLKKAKAKEVTKRDRKLDSLLKKALIQELERKVAEAKKDDTTVTETQAAETGTATATAAESGGGVEEGAAAEAGTSVVEKEAVVVGEGGQPPTEMAVDDGKQQGNGENGDKH